MKVLDRKILLDLTGGFLAGLAAAVVLLAGDYLLAYNDVLFCSRVPAAVVVQLLLLKLPAYVVMAIPMAVLLAVVLVLTRLSRDSEISAMRTGGISLARIMIPCLVFGVAASVASFLVLEIAAPSANARARKLETKYLLSRALEIVKAERFVRAPRDVTLKIGNLRNDKEGRELQVIKQGVGANDWIIAEEGKFREDTLILVDGVRFFVTDEGVVKESMQAESISIDIGRELSEDLNLSPTPFEKNQAELRKDIEHWRGANVSLSREETELYFKFSIPCASAVFALIAFPLSLQAGRREALGGVLICAGLVLAYYLLMTVGKGAGYHGTVDPRLAAWLPNLAFATAGLILLNRMARR